MFWVMVATLQILLIITCHVHVYLIVKISYLSPVFKRSYEWIFRGSARCYLATSLFIDCKNFIDLCIQFKKECVYPQHISIRDTSLRKFLTYEIVFVCWSLPIFNNSKHQCQYTMECLVWSATNNSVFKTLANVLHESPECNMHTFCMQFCMQITCEFTCELHPKCMQIRMHFAWSLHAICIEFAILCLFDLSELPIEAEFECTF